MENWQKLFVIMNTSDHDAPQNICTPDGPHFVLRNRRILLQIDDIEDHFFDDGTAVSHNPQEDCVWTGDIFQAMNSVIRWAGNLEGALSRYNRYPDPGM